MLSFDIKKLCSLPMDFDGTRGILLHHLPKLLIGQRHIPDQCRPKVKVTCKCLTKLSVWLSISKGEAGIHLKDILVN